MTQSSRGRWIAIGLAGVLLMAGVVSGVAVASDPATVAGSDPGDEGDGATVEPITQCFAGEGYPLVIGDPPATIDSVVHLSVVTDPDNGGEFGVELAGTLGDDRIVTLAAGVRLSRAGLVATGVNPFAAFDLLYTYELRLPMFDGAIDESSYAEDRPPVSAAAGTVPC
ncbi:DUF7332 family protein [Halorubrum sp. DTA98]|uniref:DUF7332 family protein n=1 Tax=Halorubrum sp. DTA98 TaxID=3402163 RepID=UPI003AAFB8FF